MAHVNIATVQNAEGQLVEVTKTSTHRDYVKVSIVENPETGEQIVLSWHLTEAAAAKFIRSAQFGYQTKGTKVEGWTGKLLPVVVKLTGKDAKAETIEAPAVEVPKSPEGDGCKCGCGTQVTGKSAYRPGHDAKHVSRLVRETREAGLVPAEVAVLSGPLQVKFRAAVARAK
ncbi:hypothetical protein KDJ05_gp56 [Arthrobacter phage Oxynfrius]|uniref:Uncharacterized protein n=1 Tax=Arthrobacter phage Oxynfrius TaxID=1897429 RepID=A0A1I9SE15_9CAUD|nr:hypothetical protein KDJ05_gp56 [Arthrobacter phage Oxynfrius]AOZ65092.1 hypothetical protein SEA_OXYNFRIUS_56 [Arthrobacter phage Oxynfrius]